MKNHSLSVCRRLFGLVALLFVFTIFTTGQIPPGYYDPAAGKTGVALQAALHNIIKGHNSVSYSSLIGYFEQTDAKPGNVVWDMYSDNPSGTPPYVYHYGQGDECGNYNGEGDCYNREHSWPQSWFNEASPMKSDMFHIYPTDGYVNGKRSNYPFGTVGTASWTSQNGCKVGGCTWPGYSGTVFEPIDTYKGDFARSYFYMSTRYYTEDGSWNVTDMTNKSQLKPWALQMLLHWHNADPVSVKETNRNNAIYNIQDNRNPFIDHPEYASMIWGNPVGISANGESSHHLIIFPNPAVEVCRVVLPAGFAGNPVDVAMVTPEGNHLQFSYTMNSTQLTIDMKPIPAGLYILNISDGNKNYTGKILRSDR